MAEIFRPPTFARRAVPDASRAVRAQTELGRNGAVYGNVGAPLRPFLFQNPTQRRAAQQPLHARNIALLQVQAAPFRQVNWPLVLRRAQPIYRVDFRNVPVYAGIGSPFASRRWELPRGPRFPVSLLTWLQSAPPEEVVPPSTDAPPATWHGDFPRPKRNPALDLLPARNLSLLAPTAAPFRPADLPNPRGARGSIALRTWLQGVSLANQFARPVGVEAFDYQRRLRREAFRTETSQRNIAPLTPVGDPFIQTQQFVPRWSKKDRTALLSWYGGTNLSTVTAPQGTPFSPIYTVPMWARPAPRFDAPPPNLQALISTLPTISVLPPYVVVYFWKRIA
jgi:hypothetical protein